MYTRSSTISVNAMQHGCLLWKASTYEVAVHRSWSSAGTQGHLRTFQVSCITRETSRFCPFLPVVRVTGKSPANSVLPHFYSHPALCLATRARLCGHTVKKFNSVQCTFSRCDNSAWTHSLLSRSSEIVPVVHFWGIMHIYVGLWRCQVTSEHGTKELYKSAYC